MVVPDLSGLPEQSQVPLHGDLQNVGLKTALLDKQIVFLRQASPYRIIVYIQSSFSE